MGKDMPETKNVVMAQAEVGSWERRATDTSCELPSWLTTLTSIRGPGLCLLSYHSNHRIRLLAIPSQGLMHAK